MEHVELTVFFLRNPIELFDAAGTIVRLEPKTQALLCYLLIEAAPVSRQKLRETFWPGQVRNNLSRELSVINSKIPSLLQSNEKTVSLRADARLTLDVDILRQVVDSNEVCDWEQVPTLYRAKFMAEYSAYDKAEGLASWLSLKQSEFRSLAQKIFVRLIHHHQWNLAFAKTLELADIFLSIHPLAQDVVEQKIRLLAGLGRYTEAIEAYRRWADAFRLAYEIEPEDHLIKLYEQIIEVRDFPRHNVVPQVTPFIGREQELKTIVSNLSLENCRAISLIGLGGMGKTRLAVQVAAKVAPCFLHGAYFISLESVDDEHCIQEIAQGLGIALVGNTPFIKKLTSVMSLREMLLVLDGVEHLQGIEDVVSELLKEVPGVKILITSRRRLNIYGVSVLELEGMVLPPLGSATEELLAYDSVQLFFHTAQRVGQAFQINRENLDDVIQIMHVLGGMPLAIELAASKVHYSTCAKILDEVKSGLKLLEHTGSGYAERHLSMRAALNYSWQYLSADAKKVLAALSVFVGGFSKHAAVSVVDATTNVLKELIEHCLIKRVDNERYDLHPLIQAFAAEKLSESTRYNEVKAKHGRYYAEWIKQIQAAVLSPHMIKHFRELSVESANVRAAWLWAVEHQDLTSIQNLKHLWIFFELQALYQEGYATFTVPSSWHNVVGLEEVTSALLSCRAWFCFRLGNFHEGKELATLSWSLVKDSASKSFSIDHGQTLYSLGMNQWYLGEYEQAREHFQYILDRYSRAGIFVGMVFPLHGLSFVAISTGAYKDAAAHLQYALNKLELDPRSVALFRMILAQVYCYLGIYEPIESLLCESRTAFEFMKDDFMKGYNDYVWGVYYRSIQHYELAIHHSETVRLAGQSIGDPWLEILATLHLASTLSDTNALERSNLLLLNALNLARRIDSYPQILNAIIQLCRNILRAHRDRSIVTEILTFAGQHPASDFESRKLSLSLLGDNVRLEASRHPLEALDKMVAKVFEFFGSEENF